MFSPPKLKTIMLLTVTIPFLMVDIGSAQQSEYQRRFDAMQRARSRALVSNESETVNRDSQVRRVAAQQPISNAAPARDTRTNRAQPIRTARAQAPVNQRRVGQRAVQRPGTQVRVAQGSGTSVGSGTSSSLFNGPISGGGSPIVSGGGIVDGGIINGGFVDGGIIDGGFIDGGYIDGGIQQGGFIDDGGCASCGDSYFDSCASGNCQGGWGGCPPGSVGDCWLGRLPAMFQAGEFFIGGTGFQLPSFTVPGATTATDDSNFGVYGGANFGVPLCRLSCGLLAGQLGVRSVNTENDGNSFTAENRDQLFVTAGLYRRVDYGLQGGVVYDFLDEAFFSDVSVSQIRADISWAWPSGSAFGFRYSGEVEDDDTAGIVSETAFTGFTQGVFDTYRIYYQHAAPAGGWCELSLGAADDAGFLLGLDFDLPITERVAMQSGFNYLEGDGGITSNGATDEAWNLSVGFVFRPQGRAWYRSYNRPLLPVADNGSFILRR